MLFSSPFYFCLILQIDWQKTHKQTEVEPVLGNLKDCPCWDGASPFSAITMLKNMGYICAVKAKKDLFWTFPRSQTGGCTDGWTYKHAGWPLGLPCLIAKLMVYQDPLIKYFIESSRI